MPFVIKKTLVINPENNGVILNHSADVPQTWSSILISPHTTGFRYSDSLTVVTSQKTSVYRNRWNL